MSTFDEILETFTASTLSLVNSRNQVREALDRGRPTVPNTRQDVPAPGPRVSNWLILAVLGFVVYKIAQ